MTFETTDNRGERKVRPSATERNASSIGSISGEWKACDTLSRRILRPCSSKTAAVSSTAASAPETTTERGPLTAATDTSGRPARTAATSSSVASTDTMAPPAGRACMSRPRAATSAAASARSRTPATCAAVISPTEWPIRWSGVTPQDAMRRYSAVSTANRAACV